MTEPDWADQPFPEKPFRFSKFYLQTLFDGALHLVRRGVDYPQAWTYDTVAKRLRNAAWWRGVAIRLSSCPEGVWAQSATAVETGGERELLAQALMDLDRVKIENAELRREVWQLKNQ